MKKGEEPKTSKEIKVKTLEPKKSEEIKEEGSEHMSKLKSGAEKNKKAAENYVGDIKKASSEKGHEIKEELKDVKHEAEIEKEKLIEKSKAEDVHPAEKVLGDIISKFKQGTDQINEMMTDYTKDSKSKKSVELPLVDVFDTNEEVILIADIPGVKKEHINLGISKNCVEIEVKYKDIPDIKDSKLIINERCYGIKKRKIPIKTDINVKKASAKWEDSVLTINLPKKEKDLTKIDIE
jgi:HSP20 family protein